MNQEQRPHVADVLGSPLQEQRPQPPQHQTDLDDEDDTIKQLNECSSVYLSLQDCLVNTNRDWKACQKDVLALKACNDARNKRKSQ